MSESNEFYLINPEIRDLTSVSVISYDMTVTDFVTNLFFFLNYMSRFLLFFCSPIFDLSCLVLPFFSFRY